MDKQQKSNRTITYFLLAAFVLVIVGYFVYGTKEKSVTMLNIQQCFNACETKGTQMKKVTSAECECMHKESKATWEVPRREVEWVTPVTPSSSIVKNKKCRVCNR